MAVTLNASTSTGLVQSADTSGVIELQSNGTTALTVNTNEGIQILNCLGVGNATPSTSGAGITFPATQSASTDANTLDDYEEGTWTPVIADAASGGNTGTFTNNGATYTKIGRQVTLQAYLNAINTTGMTAGNAFYVRGLPFTASSTAQGNFYTYRVGRDASTVSSSVNLGSGNTSVIFSLFTTNSATTDRFILVSNMVSGTSEVILTITYFV
jgi:hypothetical protein